MERGCQVILLRNAFFSCHRLFLFTSGKVAWAMSTLVIYVSKYAWKRKNLWAQDFTGILHPAKVFTVSQMFSCTLDGLCFCATWVKMNALNKFQKILEMVKFFVDKNFSFVIIFGINYSSVNIFVTWHQEIHRKLSTSENTHC